MLTKNQNFYIKAVINIFFATLSLVIIFGRSFTGVYIFGLRIGELLIGFSLLVAIFILFLPFENKYFKLNKLNFYVYKLIVISFFLIVITTDGSFTNTYTFRSSSYVWTYSFLFFSIFLTKNIKTDYWFFKLIPFFLPILYILSTIRFPQFLIDFFYNYSDKFDFVKASDLLVIFIATNYILRIVYKQSLKDFSYFLLSSSIYLPYLLYKSKGAFFPAVLFIFFNLLFYLKLIRKEKLKSLVLVILCMPIFFLSSFHIYGNFNFTKVGEEDYDQLGVDKPLNASTIQENLNNLVNEKNTGEIFYSFYVMDGRLYSQEQMANWRLQIWQDVVRDLFWYSDYTEDERYELIRIQGERRNDIFYKGFGYNEILPAMNHWSRTGTDGTNENPHNFLINALGRGGVLQSFLVVIFHLSIFLYWYKKHRNLNILLYLLPMLMTSSFDASMESVRFPFVYYSFLALIFNEKF